jgi:tetratricopeptide (TPR) repeat protein
MAEQVEDLIQRLHAMGKLTGDYNAMLKLIAEEERRLPNDHMVYVLKGWVLAGMGEIDGARNAYDRAIRLNPRSAWGHFRKGELLRDQDECQKAHECFARAVELKPKRTDFWLEKGFMEEELMQMNAAITSFENAIQRGENTGFGWYGKSRILVYQEKYEDALEAVRMAIELNPHEQEFRMHEKYIQDLLREWA